MNTFRNPISDSDASDPFMMYDPDTKYYYALCSKHNRVEIFRNRHAADIIRGGDSKVIYTPNGERDGIWGKIWAPEMHKGTNGKWYIYTSGEHDPKDWEKRLFILESESDDPFGEWHFKCKPSPNTYGIDPTVYTHTDGKQYICYSYFKDEQLLEIREMENPYTFTDHAAIIAKAEYDWELVPPYVGNMAINEGAFFVKNGDKLFIIYSANGCFTAFYCLGVLEYMGGDMCAPSSWKKHDKPLFTYGNGVYAPGHASFFYSPDGAELWCAYHGVKEYTEEMKTTPRYMHIQKVDFDDEGFPVMGIPVGENTDITPPSGEVYQ